MVKRIIHPYMAPPPPPVKSRVMRFVAAWSPDNARAVRWADWNPVAWEIVTTGVSRAMGLGAPEYDERIRHGTDCEAVLARVARLHELVQEARRRPSSLFAWRAAFAMEHFHDPRFTGGLFAQHVGRKEHFHLLMDYTPETRGEVIERFAQWTYHGSPVTHVTIDGMTVHQYVLPAKAVRSRRGDGSTG
jgi:hypothetical protein